MADRVIQRHDTAARWAEVNPVLAMGEIGIETDGAKGYKIGDGVTAWNSLPYPANPTSVVQEVGSSESAVMSQKAVTELAEHELSTIDRSRIDSVGFVERTMMITKSGEHSSTIDRIKVDIPQGRYSVLFNDVDSGNTAFYIYAEYSDGTSGQISGNVFNVGEPRELTIKNDVVSLGVYKGSGVTIGKIVVRFTDVNYVDKKILSENLGNIDEIANNAMSLSSQTTDNLFVLEDKLLDSMPLTNGYMMITGNIGDVATFETRESTGWRYIKLSVKKGEYYFVKGAYGGTSARAYTLTDVNGVITDIKASGGYTGVISIIADGFLVVNSVSDYKPKVAIVNEVIARKHTINVLDTAGLFQGAINTGGAINPDNLAQIYSGKIRVKCQMILPDGFNIRRVVYYNNYTDKYDSKEERNANNAIVGKVGCYARISIVKSDGTDLTPNDFPINNIGALVENIELPTPDVHIPLLNFDSDYTFAESFEEELDGMGASLAKNTVPSDYMERIYQKIDALIADNSDYITKYDAVELANEQGFDIAYPIYANGITEPITETITLSDNTYDVTYDVTPAYKTYIYKLSYNKSGLYGNNVKKKTIFITACTHGWEKAGSFNTYLLMKRLCEDYVSSDFYMKLRSLFDIYIIPCLNGYGIYHGLRVNARKVNINRNAPSEGWEVIEQPGHQDWSGEPNSEFETKLVCHFIDTLNPDIYFDHHNFTPDSAMISFTSGRSKLPCAPYFRALVDFTRCAMKYLPQHFGTKFNFITSSSSTYYPNGSASDMGSLHNYAYDKGIDFSFVLEVDYAIPFTNGEYTGFTNLETNTSDVYRLNEYILRSQLIHFCNAMLNYKKNGVR